MSDPNALPIAGWYPDPEDEANDRWWNGATWSDHRRPRNAGAGWAPAAAPATAAPAAAVPSAAVPTAAAPATAAPTGAAPAAVAPAAAPAYQPYAPAYAPNYAPAQQMRNPTAFAGMLTSLIGLMFNWILFGAPGIVGAIISFIGLRRANELLRHGVTTGNGRGMAIGGIVAGLAGALLFNLFYFTMWSPLVFS
jgi:hypothetical protein